MQELNVDGAHRQDGQPRETTTFEQTTDSKHTNSQQMWGLRDRAKFSHQFRRPVCLLISDSFQHVVCMYDAVVIFRIYSLLRMVWLSGVCQLGLSCQPGKVFWPKYPKSSENKITRIMSIGHEMVQICVRKF